jgi:hypothetical protein
VGYRSQHPEEETEKDVLKELKENKIKVSQLLKWKADHCQLDESSDEVEGSCE